MCERGNSGSPPDRFSGDDPEFMSEGPRRRLKNKDNSGSAGAEGRVREADLGPQRVQLIHGLLVLPPEVVQLLGLHPVHLAGQNTGHGSLTHPWNINH